MIALSGIGASSASAKTNWQGEMMITAVNAACSGGAAAVGDHALTTMLPNTVAGNGADSYIAFHINRRLAYTLKVTNGPLAAGKAYDATGISSGANIFTFSGRISKFTMSPSALTATTRFVTVSGQITNWNNVTGCTITFDAAYVLRR